MDILQIIGIALLGTVVTLILKQNTPELAVQTMLVTGTVIFLSIAVSLGTAVDYIMNMAERFGVDTQYIATVVRIIGIAYICQFAAEVCRDAGESSIAVKVEFAGRVLILLYALPIIDALLQMVVSFLP